MPIPVALIIYFRPGCHLCEDMKELVERVVRERRVAAHLEAIDVESDAELERRYGQEIPVLLVNGRKAAKFRVSEERLARLLTAPASAAAWIE